MNESETFVREKWRKDGYEMVRAGWPDFLAIKGRDLIGVEVKPWERGELTEAQERVRKILVDLGVRYVVERPNPIEVAKRLEKDDAVELGLFDPEAPAKIIAAARDEIDWGIAWCCLMQGMHPTNILALGPANLTEGGVLIWRRVKNARQLRALLDPEDVRRMESFLKTMSKKPFSREGIWKRVISLTKRAGYHGGPRILRKTFILNELRNNWGRPDLLDLVAQRAGCTKHVLVQHYLDLEQWMRIYGKPATA